MAVRKVVTKVYVSELWTLHPFQKRYRMKLGSHSFPELVNSLSTLTSSSEASASARRVMLHNILESSFHVYV